MRWLTAILALGLALACAGGAGAKRKPEPALEPAFSKAESVLKWINDYRGQPEPDRLPDAVAAMGRHGMLRELEQAGLYTGFIAGVLGSNPDKAERLIARMFPMPPEDQVILVKAIAFSGLLEWKNTLSAFTERMPARNVLIRQYLYGDAKTLWDLPLDDGSFALDCHWGYYFGSGSDRALERIVSTLAWTLDQSSVDKLTVGAMAKWTLASNSTRDKTLLDALKAQMNKQPENVRQPLRDVILAAETFETQHIRKDALASIDELKAKGPLNKRNFSWWGQAGQTVLALGCVVASVTGHVELGIPCVVGGAVSTAALKYLAPQ